MANKQAIVLIAWVMIASRLNSTTSQPTFPLCSLLNSAAELDGQEIAAWGRLTQHKGGLSLAPYECNVSLEAVGRGWPLRVGLPTSAAKELLSGRNGISPETTGVRLVIIVGRLRVAKDWLQGTRQHGEQDPIKLDSWQIVRTRVVPDQPVQSVCSILGDISKWTGKLVRVRGVIVQTLSGSFLKPSLLSQLILYSGEPCQG